MHLSLWMGSTTNGSFYYRLGLVDYLGLSNVGIMFNILH